MHTLLRRPFVTTTAALVMATTACGSTVSVFNGGGEGGEGASTSSGVGGQGPGVGGGTVNPPPPCPPPDAIVAGELCDPGPLEICPADLPFCPPGSGQATCQNGVWIVDGPDCNPPPPLPCESYLDATSCEADFACRWLVPGCTEPQPAFPEEGCFPKTPCVIGPPDPCGGGSTCTQVIVDPCWNAGCDACYAETTICVLDDSDV
ncbi:MAG: hypothetical protein KC731_09975 [Myxococcales bacterium]|nr:hypothetical protein [Myxococcales bacterium]